MYLITFIAETILYLHPDISCSGHLLFLNVKAATCSKMIKMEFGIVKKVGRWLEWL